MSLPRLEHDEKWAIRRMGPLLFDEDEAIRLCLLPGGTFWSARRFRSMRNYWNRWAKDRPTTEKDAKEIFGLLPKPSPDSPP